MAIFVSFTLYEAMQMLTVLVININFSNKFNQQKHISQQKRGELSKEVVLISVTTVFFFFLHIFIHPFQYSFPFVLAFIRRGYIRV